MSTRKRNYVNNAEFLEAITLYKSRVKEAEDCGDDAPEIPSYIGECIYQIATRLSFKPNFINYSFKEEMIGDGLENAIAALNNFDPEKSSNPFAYFTQVIYFAFIRRIHKEKKQLYIKHKVIENSIVTDTMSEKSAHNDVKVSATYDIHTDYMNDFVEKYEESMKPKEKKKKGLEKFYDEDEEKG